MKDYGLMEVQLHAFLRFALHGGKQLIHFLATSSPDKNVVVWTGKGAGLTPDLVGTLGRRKTSCPAHLVQLDELLCMQFIKRQLGNAYERTSYFQFSHIMYCIVLSGRYRNMVFQAKSVILHYLMTQIK